MSLLWGVDLGGTKIEGVVLDPARITAPLARMRVPTEAQRGYDHLLSQVRELVAMLQHEVGATPTRIGIGTPGVLDPQTSEMKNCNTQCLNGRALHTDLAGMLNVEVRIANDANLFALAEALLGAGRGATSCFGVIMGTGVGGGIVLDGRVLTGWSGIAGEWGHNLLDPSGMACPCGKRGCVETILSGPALERFYQQRSGEARSLTEIACRAEQGKDTDAAETVRHLCREFGKAISVVLNILDPEVVVLGGGVSNIAALYDEGVAEVRRNLFNNRLETRIVRNELGDSAGVFGAAMLARD